MKAGLLLLCVYLAVACAKPSDEPIDIDEVNTEPIYLWPAEDKITASENDRTWPLGNAASNRYFIPYIIDDTIPQNDALRKRIVEELKVWQESTCINFTENGAGHRIKFTKTTDNPGSPVGYVTPDQQYQRIKLQSADQIGPAVHEIGHALGLTHTHSREDRDKFLKIRVAVINPKKLKNYQKQRSNVHGVPFDLGSVMQYPTVDKTGKVVFETIDKKEISTLGNRRVPSFYDYVLVNRMYKCNTYCENFPRNFCKEGGFRHPRECARCICPRGFGGPDCGKRDNAHKCGSDLTAVSQWRELEIKMKASPENEPTCHWIIKAPHSKKVQVQFVKLDAKCDYKCSRSSLEIKIRADFALSGHRVCCLTLSQGHEWKSETQRAVVSAFAPDPLTVTIMYRAV